MKIKSLVFAASMALSSALSAQEFSYTYLGFNIGGGEIKGDYSNDYDIAYFDIDGAYQFNDNFVLSLKSQAFAGVMDSSSDEWTISALNLNAEFPLVINESVSVIPFVGLRSESYEYCDSDGCSSSYEDDESGMSYGVAARAWALPDKFEVFASYLDSDIRAFTAEKTIGMGCWLNANNRIELQRMADDYLSSWSLGYRYSW